MPLKLNISENGKAWKIELEGSGLFGKSVGDSIKGNEISPDLEGYEMEITGGSDLAGFPLSKDVEGIGLKRVLLKKGWGMKDSRKGIRLRKTVRGKAISESTVQVNLKVLKAGKKSLKEVFPEQNVIEAPKEEKAEEKPEEKAEEKSEEKKEEVKEEVKEEAKPEEKKEESKPKEKPAEEKKEEAKEEIKSEEKIQ